MTPLLFSVLSLPLLLFLSWKVLDRIARARRTQHLQAPLEPEWISILQHNMALYRRLPPDLRARLHGCINLFLEEKQFVGCDGLDITDEIRVTVAGNACLLVLNARNQGGHKDLFPGFSTILVYPDTYVAEEIHYDGIIESSEQSMRAGEAWHGGPLVLSWNDVIRGSQTGDDGFNVVLHEFAHKLDEENSAVDGLPVLSEGDHYAEWARVLSTEYEDFLARVQRGENHLIDDYGAVSPPEFFAVITETFFERPVPMRNNLPELYQQLERLYGLSPHSWQG